MARVQSSDPTRALVAPDAATPGAPYIAVTIADGQIDASFYVQGLEGQSGDVAVTVSAPGFDDGVSGTTTIAPPAYRLIGLPASVSATDPTFVFYAEIGVPTAGNTDLLNQSYSGVAQALRAGAAPLTVTVTNDNPAASQLVSASGGAQQWAVSILPGRDIVVGRYGWYRVRPGLAAPSAATPSSRPPSRASSRPSRRLTS